MSLALRRSPTSRLLRTFFSPVTSHTLHPRQRSWHLNLTPQRHCSSMSTPPDPMEKHKRPPAQFPPVQEDTPRHPYISANYNIADKLERWLRKDGHRAWGFVTYRSTYQSDADWEEFMRRLLADTTQWLESAAGPDLLDNLALTVFDDPQKFDGASTSVIRDHFKQWVLTAVQEEQGGEFNPVLLKVQDWSQRYRYCIQVTQEMLESVLAGEKEGMPFVRIIRRDWEEYSPYEDGNRLEDEQEPLEGCTLEDVGWINVPFESVMVVTYGYLRGDWDTEYRRPPTISCYP